MLVFVCSSICAVQIRLADKKDAQELADVHHTAWHATYDGVLPASYCARKTVEHMDAYWQRFFTKEDGRFALVAVENEQIVGFTAVGPLKAILQEMPWCTCAGFDAEVYKLYVLAEHHGKGVGKSLFHDAAHRLTAAQYTGMVARVFETNQDARGFYAHCGWCALHTAPITYWPGLEYYVYGVKLPIYKG